LAHVAAMCTLLACISCGTARLLHMLALTPHQVSSACAGCHAPQPPLLLLALALSQIALV